MPSAQPITCDSSVLIPALLEWHPFHGPAQAALRRTAAIPAHVHVETFSVMTRLPDPRRPKPALVHQVLEQLGRPLLELSASGYAGVVADSLRRAWAVVPHTTGSWLRPRANTTTYCSPPTGGRGRRMTTWGPHTSS